MGASSSETEGAFDAFARGRYRSSFPGLLQAARGGDIDALLAVGWMRDSGTGVGRDVEGAIDSYRQAAKLGSLEAISRLSNLLINEGRFEDAKIELEFGVNKGHATSEYQLGWLLLKESASNSDRERGWDLIRRAAEQGQIYAKRKWWSFEWQNSGSTIDRMLLIIRFVKLSWSAFWTLLRDRNSKRVI